MAQLDIKSAGSFLEVTVPGQRLLDSGLHSASWFRLPNAVGCFLASTNLRPVVFHRYPLSSFGFSADCCANRHNCVTVAESLSGHRQQSSKWWLHHCNGMRRGPRISCYTLSTFQCKQTTSNTAKFYGKWLRRKQQLQQER